MITDQIVVTAGSIFAVSGRSGDIHPRTQEGFYAYDTRFLSMLRLSLEEKEPQVVGSGQFDHSIASFYASSQGVHGLPAASVSIVRDRYIADGLHEDISLINHSDRPRKVRLKVAFDADFADVFQVRLGPVRKVGRVTVETRENQHLCLVYRRRAFHRETWVAFSAEPKVEGKTAVFEVVLEPKTVWKTCMTILPVLDAAPPPMKCVSEMLGSPYGAYHPQEQRPLSELQGVRGSRPLEDGLPQLETDHAGLRVAYHQALADLRSLQMEYFPGHHILAAGLPWFMAVFGRDSIIAAIQTKLLGTDLKLGTLHTLATLQATVNDKFREANPGKIPHEVRLGELSVLEELPHSHYYGSVDATPLFILLLWEAYQWTGDRELLRQFLPAAEAALRWIDRYGDKDQDGFVEYKLGTRHGLRNQGWKDSGDSINFANGRLAESPIALAEVQGYVYDAKRKMAEIYRVLEASSSARRLERQAQQLKEQFNDAFWMPEQGYYALALDGRKHQVDSIASNPGQCLWSGIVDEDKARSVVERLMAPDMFTGWGIRTLSTEMARYHPLSYHNGSVWPHDNSLIAAGMARYGFSREAKEVALAIIDTAAAFPDQRLPEVFAGYLRREYSFPVSYPAANVPQAWACGALIYLLETLLGVMPAGDRLLQEAPREGLSISLTGVPYRGSRRVL
ncbi:MAG: glycogen debranching N-terminal domain-containing protein [Dehalococcoidia bacterium]